MLTQEDRFRMIVGRSNVKAAANPAELTARPALQAAIAESRDDLAVKTQQVDDAAREVEAKTSRFETARKTVNDTVVTLVAVYTFVRGKVSDFFFNPSPGQVLSQAEKVRRRQLFNRWFGMQPSHMLDMSPMPLLEVLGSPVKALQDDPDLTGLGMGPTLGSSRQQLADDLAELQSKQIEGRQAMDELVKARDSFDVSAGAHALLVEAALKCSRRLETIGRYLKHRDPAFAARHKTTATPEPANSEADETKPAEAPETEPADRAQAA